MHSVTFSRTSTGWEKRHFLVPAVNVEHDKSHLKRNVEEKGYTGCVFLLLSALVLHLEAAVSDCFSTEIEWEVAPRWLLELCSISLNVPGGEGVFMLSFGHMKYTRFIADLSIVIRNKQTDKGFHGI